MKTQTTIRRGIVTLSLCAIAILAAAASVCVADDGLEQQIQQERVKLLQADVALKEASVQRLKRLVRQGVVSEPELKQAELQLTTARAKLAGEGSSEEEVLQQRIKLLETEVDLKGTTRRRLQALHGSGVVSQSELEKGELELVAAKLRLLEAKQALETGGATADNPELRKLLLERRDVLKQQVKMLEAEYRTGVKTLEPVMHAVSELTEAELELTAGRKDRIVLLEKQVTTIRELEEIVQRQFMAGQVGQQDVLAAKAARLAAQIRLAREIAGPGVQGKAVE